MTTLGQLVAATPGAGVGIRVHNLSPDGDHWRWSVEIADPATVPDVVWRDVTCYCVGITHTRGAGGYLGRYEAATADILLQTVDDRLAPWNENTAPAFGGTHVALGAGLLVRASMCRISGSSVVAWHPRFTMRVEEWGDSVAGRGRLRTHPIIARDLMSGLVNVPVGGRTAAAWNTRVGQHLQSYTSGGADWEFGTTIYGALGLPTIPDSVEYDSAINALDESVDPAGVVMFTNRKGQLVFRPQIGDTYHVDRFDGGASGSPWVDPAPWVFSYRACDDGNIAYALETGNPVAQFGIDDSERQITNHIRVTDPVNPVPYEFEDAISIQRYGRKSASAFWQVLNEQVADDIVNARAYSHRQARPLETSIDLDGFYPSMVRIDYLDPVIIKHKTAEGRQTVTADGVVRQIIERYAPRLANETIGWESEIIVDVLSVVPSEDDLEPTIPPGGGVGGPTCSGPTTGSLMFAWSNPSQTPAPTETQVRLLPTFSVWQTLPYPLNGMTWNALESSTTYRFEIRLVRRDVYGTITHVSPVESATCTTLDDTGPSGGGGPGGGGIGTGFGGGDGGDCPIEFQYQEAPAPEGPWTDRPDLGGTREADESVLPNPDDLTPGYYYRHRERTLCPGEDPGPWTDWGPPSPFYGSCSVYGNTIFDDPAMLLFVPQICDPGIVQEAVSGDEVYYGPQFAVWDSPWPPFVDSFLVGWVRSVETTGSVLWDTNANVGGLTGDQAHVVTVLMDDSVPDHAEIWQVNGVNIALDDGYIKARVVTFSGVTINVVGTTAVVAFGLYAIGVEWDATTGTLTLYVNGTATSSTPIGTPTELYDYGSEFRLSLPAGAAGSQAASFNRLAISQPYVPADFCDDFERADGALGADWTHSTLSIDPTDISTTSSIVSGAVVTAFDTGSGAVHDFSVYYATAELTPTGGRAVEVDLTRLVGGGFSVYLYTQMNTTDYARQYLYIQFNTFGGGSSWQYDFGHISSDGLTETSIDGNFVGSAPPSVVTIRYETEDDGTCRVYVGGVLALSGVDPAPVTGQPHVGFAINWGGTASPSAGIGRFCYSGIEA